MCWDSDVVLTINYLACWKTVTGDYHAELIKKLLAVVKEKCQTKLHEDVLLRRDSAPPHTSTIAMAAIQECRFKLLQHLLYFIDLTPPGLHVFLLIWVEMTVCVLFRLLVALLDLGYIIILLWTRYLCRMWYLWQHLVLLPVPDVVGVEYGSDGSRLCHELVSLDCLSNVTLNLPISAVMAVSVWTWVSWFTLSF